MLVWANSINRVFFCFCFFYIHFVARGIFPLCSWNSSMRIPVRLGPLRIYPRRLRLPSSLALVIANSAEKIRRVATIVTSRLPLEATLQAEIASTLLWSVILAVLHSALAEVFFSHRREKSPLRENISWLWNPKINFHSSFPTQIYHKSIHYLLFPNTWSLNTIMIPPGGRQSHPGQ